MKNLQRLGLFASKITDMGLMQLARHRSLQRLDVGQTAVTPAGLAALRQELPKCEFNRGNVIIED
jgi:hypothetical protein